MTKSWLFRLAALLTAAAVLWIPSTALAGGLVKWRKTTLEEIGESWKIDIEIHLSKAPDMAHIPVRFSFKPTVYFERTLVDDHDGPVDRKVPLQNRQPIVESVDIGFMDAGRGTIQKRTRFSFKVTRAHGFEAGEYQVTIKDGRSGGTIGSTQRLVFQGENEVIDRRSMVFSGEKKKKKEEDEPAEQDYTPKKEVGPDDDAYWAGGPTEPEEADGPPSIEEKPGGCGCRVGAATGSPLGASAALLVLGLALATRRMRR